LVQKNVVPFRMGEDAKLVVNMDAIRKTIFKLIALRKVKKLENLKVVQGKNCLEVVVEL